LWAQANALATAAERLDELTTATIHGFCQSLIRGYAVEADVDPGARVIDEVERDAAFRSVFDRWLKRRFAVPPDATDPIADLSRRDPGRVVTTLRSLASGVGAERGGPL
jgi:CRISPR-associated exonuclease Cas4